MGEAGNITEDRQDGVGDEHDLSGNLDQQKMRSFWALSFCRQSSACGTCF
jgi:hypothetical protein